MVNISTDAFLDLCQKSQLVSEPRLREVRRTDLSDSRAAARMLVEGGDLTRWQAGQLLSGRHSFVLGGYLLLERLGKGGMGSVYRARQLSMSRVVAVKLLARRLADNPEAQARFVREMQATAALNHPNIVSAIDAGVENGLHYLVMEYVPGRDLAEYLKKFHRLPIAWSCQCIRQAALGLQHAHDHGFIHRDIKPSNLLVAAEGASEPRLVKVLDLGMARPAAENQGGLTQLGQVLGTPDYISPEQGRDSTKADIRSDIYSLGCTLFKLLTGEPVFPGDNTVEKLLVRMSRDARRVRTLRPEVPGWLDAAIARMLARRPEDRYQTPAEAAEALDPNAVHESSVAIPIPLPEHPPEVVAEDDAELQNFLSHFGEDPAESSDLDAAAAAAEVAPAAVEGRALEAQAEAPALAALVDPSTAESVDTHADGDTPIMFPQSTPASAPPEGKEDSVSELTSIHLAPEAESSVAVRVKGPAKSSKSSVSSKPKPEVVRKTEPSSPRPAQEAAGLTTSVLARLHRPDFLAQSPLVAVGVSIAAALLVTLYLAIPEQTQSAVAQEAPSSSQAGGFPIPRNASSAEPGYFPWQGIPVAGLHRLDLQVDESGSYELALRIQEAPRGNARVMLDGRPLRGGAVELSTTTQKPVVLLGQQRLAKGTHKLEVDLGGQRADWVRFGHWRMIGPFDNSRGQGFATSYPPERDLDPHKGHPGKHDREVRWIDRPVEPGQTFDLSRVFEDSNQSVAYLQCTVHADRAGVAPLFLGSDDTLTVWLNGQTLLAKDGNRGCAPYSDQVEMELKAGENRLLFKVCQGNGAWAFWWNDQPPQASEGLLRFGLHVRRAK